MTDEDSLRSRHLTDALALAPVVLERQSWPAERLDSHRIARLRELLHVAVDRSP
jgi:hypothetical protein